MIDELDGDGLATALLDDERAVFVDFWGPMCAPCRTLRPHLERLSESYAERCRFVAVDVEKHEDVRTLFDVTTVPTFLFIRDGETIHRHEGAMTPSTIAARLDAL